MLIAVVGGKLQGMEACYLAKKAGWDVILIDKNHQAPAACMGDRFIAFEFTADNPVPPDCPGVEFILPALEDETALASVKIWADAKKIPLAFDPTAYQISASKLKSDDLFKQMGLPAPRPWPECDFPVLVKPDKGSGSAGVKVVKDSNSLSAVREKTENLIIQEHLKGPYFSIEVVGMPGQYQALQITDLDMDNSYNCKKVTAPTNLSFDQTMAFEKMAVAIAEKIGLKGIMDVEVVLHENELKLLEMDARLPSQTPIAVFWSTGINMVEWLGSLFTGRPYGTLWKNDAQYVIFEHIKVSKNGLECRGEHIMAKEGPLTCQSGFFGADEAITSVVSEKNAAVKEDWVATLIFCSMSREKLLEKRQTCHGRIRNTIQGIR